MAALLAGGCQHYERKPLDLQGHRAAFLARTPADPQVEAFAAALGSASGAPGVEFDLTDGTTIDEAEVVALVFNPDLRLARMRAGVTLATAENAGLWEDPVIGADLVRILEGTPHPWKIFTAIGLTIPISGRLEIEKEKAGVEHGAELARVAEREWMTRGAIRREWTNWSALEAELGTTRAFVEQVDQVLMVVDRMEKAGEMTRTEARLFRIEKATRMAELRALESRVREAEIELKTVMGLSPDAPIVLVSTGIGPAPRGETDPTVGIDPERRNTSVAIAVAEYEAAEKLVELEIRKQYPDLSISPGYGNEDGKNQVLMGVSLPLPLVNANRQAIAEARALREVARVTAETTIERVISAARAAEVRLESAHREREAIEAQIVPLVDAQYADARKLAQLGEFNTLVLLESLTRQHDAKVQLIDARRTEALLRIDVEEIHGPPSPAHTPLFDDHSANTSTTPSAAQAGSTP